MAMMDSDCRPGLKKEALKIGHGKRLVEANIKIEEAIQEREI